MTLEKIDKISINPKGFSSKTTQEYMTNLDGITHLKDKVSFNKLKEKDIINIIMNAQKSVTKPSINALNQKLKNVNYTKRKIDYTIGYGSTGRAIIYPPKRFGLPEMSFNIYHFDKHSTYGAEDSIIIGVSRNTPKGKTYVPTGFIGDNSNAIKFVKRIFKDIIPRNNFHLAKKDELQVRIHGNNLFCGWTIPIYLSEKVVLPAASILLEGYGNIRTSAFSVWWPSGYRMDQIGNYLESFVTFFHPDSKYSGPGTDSAIGREIIMELYQREKAF